MFHKKKRSVAAWGCHLSAADVYAMDSIGTLQTLPIEHPAQTLPSVMCLLVTSSVGIYAYMSKYRLTIIV